MMKHPAVFLIASLVSVFSLGSVSFAQEEKHQLSRYHFQCATCDYLDQQSLRVLAGKKPYSNPSLVPSECWQPRTGLSTQDANRWPGYYYYIASDRTDSDGNGLVECRVKIDFSRFVTVGKRSEKERQDYEAAMRRCLAVYNKSLQFVGLEFKEVTDSSYHVLMQASQNSTLGNAAGVSTMHGAFGVEKSSQPIYYINDSILFASFYQNIDSGFPAPRYKYPPGNPYAYVYSPAAFAADNGYTRGEISNVFLHELGHLIGLEHPWNAQRNLETGKNESYPIDWLAWPNVSNPPPSLSSFLFGHENFQTGHWSRGYYNTFMTYDDQGDRIMYPDLPAPMKAYIAHYFGIFNPSRAQILLDEARAEDLEHSPLAQGNMAQETEPNDSAALAFPLQIGVPVLGAFSSRGNPQGGLVEDYQDQSDWFALDVHASDAGRPLKITVSIGSFLYENYYGINEYGESFSGSMVCALYDANQQTLKESAVAEFPTLQFTPPAPGKYFVFVGPKTPSQNLVLRDYLLTASYVDGDPSHQPTFTPTSTATPIQIVKAPSPISLQYDLDAGLEESSVQDVQGRVLDRPDPGQEVVAWVLVRNKGRKVFTRYHLELWIDGNRYAGSDKENTLAPGDGWYHGWNWTPSEAREYSLEWRVRVDGDQNPSNDVLSNPVIVGDVVLPTSTPVFSPTVTATPSMTPVVPSPTPASTSTPTSTFTPVFPPTIPIAPTSTPLPSLAYEFEKGTLQENGWGAIPGGFLQAAPGIVQHLALPECFQSPVSADQKGLAVTVEKDQVVFIHTLQSFNTHGVPVSVRMSISADGPGASVALVALKGNLNDGIGVDGSIATRIPKTSAWFDGSVRDLVLVYEPDQGLSVTPAIQVAGLGARTTVWIDRVSLEPLDQNGSAFSSLPNRSVVSAKTYEFNQATLAANAWDEIPGGFLQSPAGSMTFGDIGSVPYPESLDGKGVAIKVAKGQTTFLYASETIKRNNQSRVILRLTLRADSSGASLALAALKGNLRQPETLDGSIATLELSRSTSFAAQEKTLVLGYDFAGEMELTPIVQVTGVTEGSATVWIDRLDILSQ